MGMKFLDRIEETKILTRALSQKELSFIVVYGRRRLGKSTLLKRVLKKDDIYFMADRSEESTQKRFLAMAIATKYEGFDAVVYPDWESLFRTFNQRCDKGTTLCLDEFPYLVKSCEALPSILQKLIDEKSLNFNLIICGSSQQMMFDIALDAKSPLYGRANEILRLTPISISYLPNALKITAKDAVKEYSVWGGVPRYWELREQYRNFNEALREMALSPNGVLHDEPMHILRDDMRDLVQASTLLGIIGNGANRLSEIAARAEKNAATLSAPLQKLTKMQLIEREIPFGENPKSSKHGIYHLSDPFMNFFYRFINPYRSLLELGRIESVEKIIHQHMAEFEGACWERLCRQSVTGNEIDGTIFNVASRWWGNVSKSERIELDVVAESIDKKTLFIGECKWTSSENAERLLEDLKRKTEKLPFASKYQKITYALFLKEKPSKKADCITYQPEDILKII